MTNDRQQGPHGPAIYGSCSTCSTVRGSDVLFPASMGDKSDGKISACSSPEWAVGRGYNLICDSSDIRGEFQRGLARARIVLVGVAVQRYSW